MPSPWRALAWQGRRTLLLLFVGAAWSGCADGASQPGALLAHRDVNELEAGVGAAPVNPPPDARGHAAHAFLQRAGSGHWRHIDLSLLEAASTVALANVAAQVAGVHPGVEAGRVSAPPLGLMPPEQLQLMADMGRLEDQFEAARAHEGRLREQLLDEAARLQAAEQTKGAALAAARAASALVRNIAIAIAIFAILCIVLGLWSYTTGRRLPASFSWTSPSTQSTTTYVSTTVVTIPGDQAAAQPQAPGLAAAAGRPAQIVEPDAEEEPPSAPPTPDTGGAADPEAGPRYFSLAEDAAAPQLEAPSVAAAAAPAGHHDRGHGPADGQAATAEDAWWEHRSPT